MRWFLIALAACGSTPPTPLAGSAADVPHRATQAPTIVWHADTKTFDTGLPAVARAGELVVVPIIERDGERGLPNLRIEARDKSDKTVQKIDVITSNEMEAKPDQLAARIDAANIELRKLHDLHDLVTMQPLDIQPPVGGGNAHLAMGDGLDVDWGGDHLHVFRHNSDRAVVSLDGKAWRNASYAPCKACGTCDYVSYLRAAYHVPEISVIVVDLGYRSDRDVCGEASDQPHVVTW